jgi:hypothetical protein
LQPYQQDALNQVLATMDPQQRAMMQPQLEGTFAMLSPSQVQQLLASMTAKSKPAAPAPAPAEPKPAAPEDLAFNRAQYEPAIRSAWKLEREYDEFVEAQLAAPGCPPQGTYAVYGSAWRYEVMPPRPIWPRASNGADLDVQVLGPSYAPQDGRYKFDFSKVRATFDRAAVAAAIKSACAEYVKVGTAFVAEAKARIVNDSLPTGQQLEQAANGKLLPMYRTLEETVKAQAPASDYGLFTALQNPQRIN